MSADQLKATNQKSISLVPCFSLGDKLLAPERKITSLPGGGRRITGSLKPKETAALMGADSTGKSALQLLGVGPDALKLNLYDMIAGLGLKLDGPLREILQSDIENAQLSYLSEGKGEGQGKDEVTYIEFTTEHYSAVFLSAKNTLKAGKQTLCSVSCQSGLDIAALIPLTDPQNMPKCELTAALMYANVAMTKADITRLRRLCDSLTKSAIKLFSIDSVEAGISVLANMTIGDKIIPLYLPLKGKSTDKNTSPNPSKGPTGNTTTNTSKLQPASTSAPVGKTLGPVSIASFGLNYKDDDLVLTLDASLKMASFQMDMMGLSLKLNFKALMQADFEDGLGFDLDGLYMSMQSGGFGLSGGLLRSKIVENGVSRDEYVGQLALKTKVFSLTALGAYSRLSNGDHSLFAYLALNYPLGGVPPFFVEGLALGFGYNRGVLVPPVSQVNQFPLVTALKDGQSIGNTLDDSAMKTVRQKFQALSKYLPAISDQYLIAAGIKFSTFKMIDSIAVLMVEFGERVSVHLVGISDMRLPFGVSNPVVSIEMAYRVSFMPDQGVLSVDAVLTDNSFVLSRDCKLT
ncbi:MAG: hypothetical protein MJK04_33235, partial [Psychrosphaera sp.]|nr:hypothetical protein [Psychrosphaera sp.]